MRNRKGPTLPTMPLQWAGGAHAGGVAVEEDFDAEAGIVGRLTGSGFPRRRTDGRFDDRRDEAGEGVRRQVAHGVVTLGAEDRRRVGTVARQGQRSQRRTDPAAGAVPTVLIP